MSTPDKPIDQNDCAGGNAETKSPLYLVAAVLSFILPGFGQLTQGRFVAFFWHLLLYVLAAALPYMMLYFFWESLPSGLAGEIIPVFVLLPFPFLMVLFSALDAAYWKRGEPSRIYRPIRTLGIVIGCVCVALTLLLPLISVARETARRMQCANNMKQLALMMHYYHDVYKAYPPAYTVDESGKPLHSWRVLLLPYMYQQKLYDEIHHDEPWDSEYNQQFHSRMPSVFRCPSDKASGARAFLQKRYPNMDRENLNCNYSVIVGEQTMFPGSQSIKNSDIAATSNTIMIIERLYPVCWMDPTHEITYEDALRGVNASIYGPGSAHNGGCMAAVADGCERYISETITPEQFKAMLMRADGDFFE